MPLPDEHYFLDKIAFGNEKAFKTIFFHYVPRIQPFVFKMTRSHESTEEIIHDIFLRLWMNKEKLNIIENFESYLFKAVSNKTFTYLKQRATERKNARIVPIYQEDNSTEDFIGFKESDKLIKQAIERLPTQRKLIFKLSREEGLSHDEIARELHISKNTIKNQIVSATRFIKEYIHNASLMIVFLIFSVGML